MILIGYWNERGKDNYIDPKLLVDAEWEKEDRDKIIEYLASGTFKTGYFGRSKCRICGCRNGSTELTDGIFYWPQGLAHYVKEHNVALPAEFVEHMRAADFNPSAKINKFQRIKEGFWQEWCDWRGQIIRPATKAFNKRFLEHYGRMSKDEDKD